MEHSNFYKLKIGIIGYGRFGKTIAENLFPEHEKNIYSPHVAAEDSGKNHFLNSITEVVEQSDIIIPAVPINQFEQVTNEVAKYITKDKTVLDVCSVKKYPVEVMQNHFSRDVNIVASHPMFGPTGIKENNGSVSGFSVVVHNVHSDNDIYETINKYFTEIGLHTIEMEPDAHDKLQAETQYLAQKLKFTFNNLDISEPSVIDTLAVKSIKDAFQLMQTSRELLEDMEKYNPYCLPLFKKFMKASTTNQKHLYYLGPEGSFNDILVQKLFKDEYNFTMCSSFDEVVEKTKSDSGSIGVLGIENSISSDVHSNIDIMFNERLHILGEASLKIRMNLIGLKDTELSDIKDVYSHPQALLQCSEFIKKHSLNAHPLESTSHGKKLMIKEQDKTKGVIGSSALADKESLEIIISDIANIQHNMTRFIFVSTKEQNIDELGENKNKLTYIFQVRHQPGSLAVLLSELAKEKINLTKIQSRPIPGTDWEYDFWVDMEIPFTTQQKINDILHKYTTTFQLLGAYEKGKVYES